MAAKKTNWKKLGVILLGLAIVVVIVLNFAKKGNRGTEVYAEEIKSRELVEIVSASGRIQPSTKVDITSEVNGEIISLLAKEGDYVEAGKLLIVLDTVQLRSDVNQARFAVSEINARLEGAKAKLEQSESEYRRQERLYKDGLTSEALYDQAKYDFASSKSSYDAALAGAQGLESALEKAEDYFSRAKIVAPMAGIVTYVDAEVGEIAAAQTSFTQGKTLMTISNLDVFEVEVEVDETEINKVALAQSADIEVDAFPDTVFAGEVVEIGNTAIVSGAGTQEQSTNFNVKVIFNDPDVPIRPGMSATVDIITAKETNALAVPYSAIVIRSLDMDSLELARNSAMVDSEATSGSGLVAEANAAETNDADTARKAVTDDETKREEIKGVFVMRNGKAHFIPVETGIADQKFIAVTDGLAPGDTVISGPYRVLRTLQDGGLVKKSERLNTTE